MMSGVIICFPSAGLPSRSSFRTASGAGDFLAMALPVIKLPSPTSEKSEVRWPIRFLRLRKFEFITISISFPHQSRMLRQCKTENVASGSDSNVLLVLQRITHRRSTEILAGVEVPQRLSGLRVDRLERLCVIAEENQ